MSVDEDERGRRGEGKSGVIPHLPLLPRRRKRMKIGSNSTLKVH